MNVFNLFNINISTPATGSKVTSKDPTYTSKNHRKLGFPRHVVEKALENAIKNREFEIQMYWKRATYFWLFVSALWVALGKLLYDWHFLDGSLQNNPYQFATLFVLSCAGMGLSFAWYMVNKGSKFWQENWEYQINFLENEIEGPSYKTILSDCKIHRRNGFKQECFGSFPFSVSKINVIIAYSNVVLWLISVNVWFLLLLFHEHVAAVISGLHPVLKSQIDSSPTYLYAVFNAIVMLALLYFSKISRSGFESMRDSKLIHSGKVQYVHQRRA